jgi:hypothetical protein
MSAHGYKAKPSLVGDLEASDQLLVDGTLSQGSFQSGFVSVTLQPSQLAALGNSTSPATTSNPLTLVPGIAKSAIFPQLATVSVFPKNASFRSNSQVALEFPTANSPLNFGVICDSAHLSSYGTGENQLAVNTWNALTTPPVTPNAAVARGLPLLLYNALTETFPNIATAPSITVNVLYNVVPCP